MIAALKASILHWKQIVLRDPDHSPGSDECALCAKYMHCLDDNGEGCDGCPIATRAGDSGCANTPYEDAEREHSIDTVDGRYMVGEPAPLRQKMLDYLRDTLAMVERGEL